MASRCSSRIINRASIPLFKSSLKPTFQTPLKPSLLKPTTPIPRFSLSRCPLELGAVQSMLPLHSAVATARLTSRLSMSCRALSQGTLCRTSPSL